MKILRARELGLCFGVRDALDAAFRHPRPRETTIHGELVHNRVVLDRLRERGFPMVDESDREDSVSTPEVLITAHGVSDRERERLRAAGHELIDTTCPLVLRAHDVAKSLEAEGRHVVVIGRPGHVEVEGLVGDLGSYDIVAGPGDVRDFGRARLGVVCQTTTPAGRVRDTLDAIERENPAADLRFVDTVCQPTKERIDAVEELAELVEVIVVVGGTNSNNTKQLARLSESRGVPAHHVQGAEDLRAEWFDGVETVGLTAGTSTLDETVDAVERRLEQLAAGGFSASIDKPA